MMGEKREINRNNTTINRVGKERSLIQWSGGSFRADTIRTERGWGRERVEGELNKVRVIKEEYF